MPGGGGVVFLTMRNTRRRESGGVLVRKWRSFLAGACETP